MAWTAILSTRRSTHLHEMIVRLRTYIFFINNTQIEKKNADLFEFWIKRIGFIAANWIDVLFRWEVRVSIICQFYVDEFGVNMLDFII